MMNYYELLQLADKVGCQVEDLPEIIITDWLNDDEITLRKLEGRWLWCRKTDPNNWARN